MKKILFTALTLVLVLSLGSCAALKGIFNKNDNTNDDSENADATKPGSNFKMIARVTEIAERISIDVIESEYTSGIHWVITANATEYFDKEGNAISRSDIKVGDTVEILYSGQVMMSYPPQIVAARITVK
ncbi:MAG: hypothetical protein E7673_04675 [Ruminococcaceae bacterium]|nr:hypothetical protein [Oscillospiraceae bacterium]